MSLIHKNFLKLPVGTSLSRHVAPAICAGLPGRATSLRLPLPRVQGWGARALVCLLLRSK